MTGFAANDSSETSASTPLARSLVTFSDHSLERSSVASPVVTGRLLRTICLTLGLGISLLLALLALSAAPVLIFWRSSPVGLLLGLMLLYAGAAAYLGRQLAQLLRGAQSPC